MAKTDKAVIELIINGQVANKALKDLEAASRQLYSELRKIEDPSKRAELAKTYQIIRGEILKTKDEINGTNKAWDNFKKNFTSVATGVLGGNILTAVFQKLTMFIPDLISRNAKLSDSLADVRQTTGLTESEMNKLNKALKNIDTRTASKELREIVKIGGQFGVAKGQLLDFTKAVDKINVVLSSEFGGGAEEIATTVAGLRNVFSDIRSDNIDQDLTKIGNALIVLAQEGIATAPVVSDLSNRIGGIGIPLGLSTGQVLGLAAATQELNISTERGGTAIGKILQKMTQNVSSFAQVAGMDVTAFKDLINKDLYGAFIKVIEGSKKAGPSATALSGLIKELEISGAGASEVFAKFGGNVDLIKEKVELAGKSIGETSAITEQFNIKNDNLGAKLDKIGKWISGKFTNSGLVGFFTSLVSIVEKFVRVPVSESLEKERIEFLRLETQIFSTNEKSEDRIKLVKILQEKYPNYLKNIDAETASSKQLRDVINEINGGLINKIIIQKQEEKIAETSSNLADAEIERGEAKLKLIDELTRLTNRSTHGINEENKSRLQGLPPEIQAQELLNENIKLYGISRVSLTNVAKAFSELKKAEENYAEASQNNNILIKEKKRLLETLGINLQETTNGGTGGNPDGDGGGTSGGMTDEQKKDFEKNVEDLAKFEQAAQLSTLDDTEKKKEVIRQKALELVEKFHGQKEYIQRVYAAREIQLEQITVDANQNLWELALKENEKSASDAADQEVKDLKERIKTEKDILDRANREKIAISKIGVLMAGEDPTAKKEALIHQLEVERDIELQNKELLESEKLEITKRYQAQILELTKGRTTKEIEDLNKIKDATISLGREIGQSVLAIQDENRNSDYNTKISQLEREKDSELSNKKLTTKQKEKIEKEFDGKLRAIRIKQFEDNKVAAKSQAAINGALAVTKILAEVPKGDFGIATGILIGAAIATTLAQTLVIDNQKPNFRKGGVAQGAKHENGGISLVDSGTGRKVGEMEGGEPYMILSDNTYRNNSSIVDALLDASMNRNGAPILPDFSNFTRQTSRFEKGGVSSTKSPSFQTSDISNNTLFDSSSIIEELKGIREDFKQLEIKVEAKISYQQLKETFDTVESIKSNAKI